MIAVIAVLLLSLQYECFVFAQPSGQRVWSVDGKAALLDAIIHANAGDTIELESGDYVFSALNGGIAPITIDKPLTLRSRERTRRAIFRTDSSSLLFAITSSKVTLSDIIIGRQVVGGNERSIDILIGAGTQTKPANSRVAYGVSTNSKRSLPSQKEIVAARQLYGSTSNGASLLRKRNVDNGSNSMRALFEIRINNVDFTKSRSGTNIAFAQGSYADSEITHCSFGRAGATYINALVGAADARFVNFAANFNSFVDTEAMFGSTSIDATAFGVNYWQPEQAIYIGGAKRTVETYCVDSVCTALAPVMDLDQPELVFATLNDAVASGATRIRVVDDVVLTEHVVISRAGTTIEGNAGCGGAPIVRVARGASIISFNGALTGVRNLRFSLVESGAVAVVYTDGVPQWLPIAKFAENLLSETNGAVDSSSNAATSTSSAAIFDGVSFLGDDSANQIGILLSAPRVRIETEDILFGQVENGIVVHRGGLTTSSTTFFGSSGAAIYTETTTRQASLKISDSTFIDCESPIQLGAGATAANLLAFRVSCSQFLFNRRINPIVSPDCVKQPALCAEALKYNTIVTDLEDEASQLSDKVPVPPAVRAERRMLRQGMNHVETGRQRAQYVYFGDSNEFSLQDSQGRLSSVSGVLLGGAKERAFLLASYAPLREECTPLDSTQFGATASIVSSVLEVRSDALLHECATLSASFRIANGTLLPPLANLGVYGVTHLGSNPTWNRETSTTVHASPTAAAGKKKQDDNAIIETSLSMRDELDRHTHRIVVVSHAPLPDSVSNALSTGAATTIDQQRLLARSLCVACNGADIPSYLLDAHCSGNSENIRTSLDAAYDELGFGTAQAPRQEAVALFVYGTCKTRKCVLKLDQNEIIEGASMIVRGVITRDADVACKADDPLIMFTDRSSKAALRYISLDARSIETSGGCAIVVAPSPIAVAAGPTIAYSSISGTLCVDSRSGGTYIGNDIASSAVAVFLDFHVNAPTKKHSDQPVIFEANRVVLGDVVIAGLDLDDKGAHGTVSRYQVRADRNTFGTPGNGFVLQGQLVDVTMTNNKQIGLLQNDASQFSRFTQVNGELANDATINLHQHASASFVANSVARNCSVRLSDSVHLADIAFDSQSTVSIDAKASVVLRQVLFEDVASSLQTAISPAICAVTEKSVTGIDVLRSTIFNVDGERIFTQQQLLQVLAANSKYFFALDGSMQQCAAGAQRVRDETQCGCPENLVTSLDKSFSGADDGVPLVGEEDVPVSAVVVDDTIGAETATPPPPSPPIAIEVAQPQQDDTAPAPAVSSDSSSEDSFVIDVPIVIDPSESSADDESSAVDDSNSSDNNSDSADDNNNGSDSDSDIFDDDDNNDNGSDSDGGDDDDDDEETAALFWLLFIIPGICLLICCCVLAFTRYRGTAAEQTTTQMSARAPARVLHHSSSATSSSSSSSVGSTNNASRLDHLNVFTVEVPPQQQPAAPAPQPPTTATQDIVVNPPTIKRRKQHNNSNKEFNN